MCQLPHPLLSKDEFERLVPSQQTRWIPTTRAQLRAAQWSKYTTIPAVALGFLGGCFVLISVVNATVAGPELIEGPGGGILKGYITAAVLLSVAAVVVGVLGCVKARSIRVHGDQNLVYMQAPVASSNPAFNALNNQAEQGLAWNVVHHMQVDAMRTGNYY
jgi:hypothetical protein